MGNQCSGNSVDDSQDILAQRAIRSRTVKKMGWLPDLPDNRDLYVKFPRTAFTPDAKDASRVDLRPKNGGFPIFDQGQLGSCTANALAAAYHFCLHRENVEKDTHFKDFTPSRLFIYYIERSIENTVDSDSGAQIRDGVKAMHKLGVCSETDWPYDDGPDRFKLKPSKQCFELAAKCAVQSYARVEQKLDDLRNCIRSGFPFVFGFVVNSSFQTEEVARTGKMPMPTDQDKPLGGHAVCAVGFDDPKKVFIVRNSWGPGWGDHGFFYMPYDYMCDPQLAQDFWAINFVSGFPDTARKARTS